MWKKIQQITNDDWFSFKLILVVILFFGASFVFTQNYADLILVLFWIFYAMQSFLNTKRIIIHKKYIDFLEGHSEKVFELAKKLAEGHPDAANVIREFDKQYTDDKKN